MAKKTQSYVNNVYLGPAAGQLDHPPVRVLFQPHLDEMTKIGDQSEPKFELQIGFPPEHPGYAHLKDATREAAFDKWGDDFDLGAAIGSGDFDVKFVDGDEEYENLKNPKKAGKESKDYPQLKGLVIMKLRSKKPIAVFDIRRRKPDGSLELLTDKAEIRSTVYGGCYIALKLTFATYDAIGKDGNPGVTAYPEELVFIADGERLGGGVNDGAGFAQVQGAETDENPETGEESQAKKTAW